MRTRYFLSALLMVILWSAYSQPTGWEVDPSDYEYSASYTWQVIFTSSVTVEESDYMAAFIDGEVHGVEAGLYHPGFDAYYFPVLVYRNTVSGEGLTFMFYDASEDSVYEIDREYGFEVDQSQGSYSDPLLFTIDDLLPQTITFNTLDTLTYGDASFALTASSSSGLPISYSSSDETVATISDGNITIVGAGSTEITASQEGDNTYDSAEAVTQRLVVNQASQVIVIDEIEDVDISLGSIDITGSSSSGLEVVFSLISGPATLYENTLILTGTGEVVVAADQEGNVNYLEATQVTESFLINDSTLLDQEITFTELSSKTYGDEDFELSAVSSSGLTVSYVSSDPSVASIVGSIVTIHSAGSVTITASQSGNEQYNPADDISQTLRINPGTQVISFDTLPDMDISVGEVDLIASSTSGLDLSFSILSGPGLVQSGVLILLDTGTLVVAADQPGNSNYLAAVQVVRTMKITQNSAKQSQSISFGVLPIVTYGDEPFSLSASSNSELKITYTSSDTSIVKISDGNLIIQGAGVVEITASQSGNEIYNPAKDHTQLLVVNKSILNVSVSNVTVNKGDVLNEFEVNYSGFVNDDDTSVLEKYPVVSTDAKDTEVIGEYTLYVNGGQDENYDFAYSNGLLVIESVLGVNGSDKVSVYPNPAVHSLKISSPDVLNVEVIDLHGKMMLFAEVLNQEIQVHELQTGIYIVRLKDRNNQLIESVRIVKR